MHAGGKRDGSLRIVLADDHALVRTALCRVLRDAGIEIAAQASDGDAAIREVAEHQPDVAVIDVGMRPTDGLEAIRRIHAECPHIGLVAISGRDDWAAVAAARQAGALGFVTKVAGQSELYEAIVAARDGKCFVSCGVRDAPSAPHELAALALLSKRELEILSLVARGHSSAQIAAHLSISPRTADAHRANILDKLGVQSVAEAARLAERHGLV